MNKLIGIFLIMVGIVATGFILFHTTYFSGDSDLEPPVVIEEPDNTASSSPIVSTSTDPDLADPDVVEPKPNIPGRYPDRLIIPGINVNADVQYVGTRSDGAMANPTNFRDVAWYKSGTVPGERGSAVIAGHVDNALALSGVFKDLEDLQAGDEVIVQRADGKKLTFVVERMEYYPYKEAPNEKVFLSSDGKAHLNLVTCAGTWIKAERSYTERLVVYTTLAQ